MYINDYKKINKLNFYEKFYNWKKKYILIYYLNDMKNIIKWILKSLFFYV